MRRLPPRVWLPTLLAAAALAALGDWLRTPPLPPLRLPTAQGSLAEARRGARPAATTRLDGPLERFAVAPGESRGAWPAFRGTRRDNVADLSAPLAASWPAAGPPLRWCVTLGDGHAAPAVRDGRVYLLDYDETRGGDLLRCLSLHDGRDIWRRFYAARSKRNHGISRTVPALDGAWVVTLGPQCHVLCADARDGTFRWGLDLVARYNTSVPLWYAGQCPLLDNGVAVLAPAGDKVLLTGIDLASGQTLWETPNPGGWQMSHASVVVATFHGVRQYLYSALGGIAGVAAEGPARGRLLWQTGDFTPGVVAPSPLPLPGDRFLQTAGYGAGSVLFAVTPGSNGSAWAATPLARYDRRLFACEQQTPVWRDGLLYGVLPSDAGDHRQEFVCFDPATGTPRWRSGPRDRFGLGPFVALGAEHFALLDDRGVLTLARANGDGYNRLCRATIFADGRDAWGPLAFVDGLLLLRDSTRLACLELGEERER